MKRYLARTLDDLTGNRVPCDDNGPLVKSKPGEHRKFAKNWLK